MSIADSEEEEVSEEDMEKLERKTTKEQQAQAARKQAGLPEILEDAVPSSYAHKILRPVFESMEVCFGAVCHSLPLLHLCWQGLAWPRGSKGCRMAPPESLLSNSLTKHNRGACFCAPGVQHLCEQLVFGHALNACPRVLNKLHTTIKALDDISNDIQKHHSDGVVDGFSQELDA